MGDHFAFVVVVANGGAQFRDRRPRPPFRDEASHTACRFHLQWPQRRRTGGFLIRLQSCSTSTSSGSRVLGATSHPGSQYSSYRRRPGTPARRPLPWELEVTPV